jgi:diguanylate cyclase (GGDEF)-like protein
MYFSRLSPLCEKAFQLIYRRIVVVLIGLLCVGLGIGLAGSYNLSMTLVEFQAQQYASTTINTLNQSRALYSESVAQRLKPVKSVLMTPEYHDIPGAIPIPATFSIELSERLSDPINGSLFRLYSDYPFPNRQKTGGPQDQFEKDALKYLRKNPTTAYYRKEKIDDRVTFRYAEAVRMKPSCLECHNRLASSPKKDWKVGDVRGVTTITQPLDRTLLIVQSGLRSLYGVLIFVALLAVLALTLVIGRFRLIHVDLEQKVAERTAALNSLVNLDSLTQIANRRHFDQRLNQEWLESIRHHQPLSILLCDVDFFKQYNDYYGHPAGDDCLRSVALTLKDSLRRNENLVARYGGEEFAIILPGVDDSVALDIAKRINQRIRTLQIPHASSPIAPHITISIGVATIRPMLRQRWELLIQRADEALYQAKGNGRDRAVSWDEQKTVLLSEQR